MRIYIKDRLAKLKAGSSFDFIAENRAFTGSDSYTLNITFPLRGCAENVAIFGNLHRKDVDAGKIVFDCVIADGNFLKSGVVTVTEISEEAVKTQFLEGRSEQNFNSSFDEVFINELPLGVFPEYSMLPLPETRWRSEAVDWCVCLPWVNNTSGNMQNDVKTVKSADGGGAVYDWADGVKGLSFQPYLIRVAEKIVDALGYAADFSQWRQSYYRNLVVCNALPFAWKNLYVADALPHWTVTEFFEEIEKLLCCEIEVAHKMKTVTLSFITDNMRKAGEVELSNVLDEYSVNATDSDESDFIGSANVKYSDCSHSQWKYDSCRWLIDNNIGNVLEFGSLDELFAKKSEWQRAEPWHGDDADAQKLLHVKDSDTYFILYESAQGVRPDGDRDNPQDITFTEYKLRRINVFGESVYEKDSGNSVELKIVPAWIDDTGRGRCIFLDVPEMDADSVDYDTRLSMEFEQGENSSKEGYYDKIFVAFWNGTNFFSGRLPCPVTDFVVVADDGWSCERIGFIGSLRLDHKDYGPGTLRSSRWRIDPKKKYAFKFIADTLPDARAVFLIKGKKYLAEKITATFTEDGMSQLMKGEFYRIMG